MSADFDRRDQVLPAAVSAGAKGLRESVGRVGATAVESTSLLVATAIPRPDDLLRELGGAVEDRVEELWREILGAVA